MAEGVTGNGGDSKFDKQMDVKKLQQLGLVVSVGLMSSEQPLRNNHLAPNHLLRMEEPDSEKQKKKKTHRCNIHTVTI